MNQEQLDLVEMIIHQAGKLVEDNCTNNQELLIVASAMFAVVKDCYRIALGEENADKFFRREAGCEEVVKYH